MSNSNKERGVKRGVLTTDRAQKLADRDAADSDNDDGEG